MVRNPKAPPRGPGLRRQPFDGLTFGADDRTNDLGPRRRDAVRLRWFVCLSFMNVFLFRLVCFLSFVLVKIIEVSF